MTARVQVRRPLAHPPERVWRAFTDPGALAAWFWPERFGTRVELDLRVGGHLRIDGPGAGMAVSGVYRHVEPPARLVFTWRWDGAGEETLVTVEFRPTDGGTELVVTHEGFVDRATGEQHGQGWNDCLDRLPAALA